MPTEYARTFARIMEGTTMRKLSDNRKKALKIICFSIASCFLFLLVDYCGMKIIAQRHGGESSNALWQTLLMGSTIITFFVLRTIVVWYGKKKPVVLLGYGVLIFAVGLLYMYFAANLLTILSMYVFSWLYQAQNIETYADLVVLWLVFALWPFATIYAIASAVRKKD